MITPGHVLIAIVGSALFVTVVALIAFGLGAIIRHTAGRDQLRDRPAVRALDHHPAPAGHLALGHHAVLPRRGGPGDLGDPAAAGNPHLWSTWPQFLVTVIWAVVLVGVGGYLFRKRDA